MPRKPADRERGSSCTLEAVKQYLQSDTIPEGYNKNDKRALRRRAKAFVMIDNDLYFTGGRSRHNRHLLEKLGKEDENPENEPDHTQTLRKVLFTEEEQQAAIDNAHVAEDGSHCGMEKTTDRVSSQYYWMGIVYGVRNTIHNCLSCGPRSKSSVLSRTRAASRDLPGPMKMGGSAMGNTYVERDAIGDGDFESGAEIGDLNDDVEGDQDVQSQTLGVSTLPMVKQEPVDTFYVTKEICNYFWQKVEIQVFGPYSAGGKNVYVAIALDCYSQFPDATVMEVLSSAAITHFVLNLFCRYGMMEKLLLLQNKVLKNKDVIINTNDMWQAGIALSLLFPQVNPLDERWQHVEKSLDRFVCSHPDVWHHCLEAFLVPLRITLPPEAEYSPYFLVHGREPTMPSKLMEHWSVNEMASCEVQLTEDQEKQTVEMITAAYGVNSHQPSFPTSISLPEFTAVELIEAKTLPSAIVGSSVLLKERIASSKMGRKRKRGRPSKTATVHEEKGEEEQMDGGVTEAKGDWRVRNSLVAAVIDDAGGDDCPFQASDHDDDSDRDATYIPEVKTIRQQKSQSVVRSSSRKRKATLKVLEADILKKQFSHSKGISTSSRPKRRSEDGQAPKHAASSAEENICSIIKPVLGDNVTMLTHSSRRKRGRPKKRLVTEDSKGFGNSLPDMETLKGPVKKSLATIQELPFDAFCFILAQYKECGIFPPGTTANSKQTIMNLSSMVNVYEGRLYSQVGKSTLRHFITSEKARFGILRKAHVQGEEHRGRSGALKFLADAKVFWKGMSLDLDAFIHACPECTVHNPLHNKPVVHIPCKSVVLSTEKVTDNDPHLSEDEEEETAYENIIKFMTDGNIPNSIKPFERSRIALRSRSMCMIPDGSSYYLAKVKDSNHLEPTTVRVLVNAASRKAAIKEAHLENGQHLSAQDTQTRLRNMYFWSGMTADVVIYVMGCCMEKASPEKLVPHRNPVIQARVDKFLKYYAGKEFPKLDTTLIASSEIVQGKGMSGSAAEQGQRNDGNECSSQNVDQEVVKAIGSVIENVSKSLTGEDRESTDKAKASAQSPFYTVRSRKDAHNCPHCGKFISGNVAFRIHMYKHTGVKPFNCPICGKTFTTSKSLQVHTRKHTGVRPYLCNQCGREFFRGTSFKYHLKTHNRTKTLPVPCDQCNREFLTQNRLAKHKEFKHPTVPKMYICKHCGRTFSTSRSLKWHEQSHSNPRKFQCVHCSKEFNRKEYLDTHTKMSHAQQVKLSAQSSADLQSAVEQNLHVLHHVGLHSELQQQQQQEGLPQSQHLLQSINIPTTSSINLIQWSTDDENQQAVNRIAISDHPGAHITITDPTGQISLDDHHHHHHHHHSAHIRVENHTSPGSHQILSELQSQFSISQDPTSGHIHIVQTLGDQIRISEHPGGHIRITENCGGSVTMSIEDQVGAVDSQSLAQAGTHTVHILNSSQLPLPAQSPQLQSATSSPIMSAGQQQHMQSGQHDAQLLQQEVQYEMEVDPSTLTEADLNAVQMLAQASLGGHTILHHSSQSGL